MYNKLKIGGYVIIDDWFGFPARTACEDFFDSHGLSVYQGSNLAGETKKFDVVVVPIDSLSTYWEKTVDVDIQYWRYQERKFKK
jgi:hypothetical protein